MIHDLLQFSALSRLNTGNVVLDFFSILFFGFALQLVHKFNVLEYLATWRSDLVRTIKHTRNLDPTPWSLGNGEDIINDVLINAIVFYINRVIPVKFRESEVFMMQLPHHDRGVDTTDIMFVPGGARWTHLCFLRGCEISIMRSIDENSDETSSKPSRWVTEVYMLRARGGGDKDRAIEEFIDRAHSAYKEYINTRLNKNTRFYFTCTRTKGDDGDGDGAETVSFKKYALTSNKKLEHIAHPAIPKIRKTLTDLLNSTGKFAVDGHAKKATFLLHGPPGTGKTSLIKAIANFTNRHIVSINLANVQTSQELMDIMFSERIGTHRSSVKVRNEEVVFVMEDVDAACDLVKERGCNKSPSARSDKDFARSDKDFARSDKDFARPDKGSGNKESAASVQVSAPPRDPLTLATLLNVLDGALECENRIVIMTTNYPERLDRALVRPGRITVNVEMGYIGVNEAVQIIERYFPGSTGIREPLDKIFGDKNVTPAEVEMACSVCESVEEVVLTLQ